MVDVFVCYRSADARFGAAATYELLARRLGRDRVFLDNQSMPPGSVFPELLLRALDTMRVLLVLIGPQWNSDDPSCPGRSLIHAPDNWVRAEIRTGLGRGVHVVPVLLDGARLPAADELPMDVRGVVERQTTEVRHRHLGADIARLGDVIDAALGTSSGAGTEDWPLAREVDNLLTLGVHPSPMRPGGAASCSGAALLPPYVARDADEALRWAVSSTPFVLVVGEAMAGKSRSAYEAVRCTLPDHRLVVCDDRAALSEAVAKLAGKCVLWLDEIERFFGPGGLTVAMVSELIRRGVVLVATIRAQCRAELAQRGRDVVRLAYEVHLARHWNAGEVDRAAASADHRVCDATRHAWRFGIAEYLAAGPQLLARWRDAWSPGSHPRAAALVAAAVDAFRSGTRRGIAAGALRRLHGRYLAARGGQALRPESFDEALAWATEALPSSSGLLVPAGHNRYLPFGYLVDAVDADVSAEPAEGRAPLASSGAVSVST